MFAIGFLLFSVFALLFFLKGGRADYTLYNNLFRTPLESFFGFAFGPVLIGIAAFFRKVTR